MGTAEFSQDAGTSTELDRLVAQPLSRLTSSHRVPATPSGHGQRLVWGGETDVGGLHCRLKLAAHGRCVGELTGKGEHQHFARQGQGQLAERTEAADKLVVPVRNRFEAMVLPEEV